MSRCRSCGAEIKWIKLKSGKYNPVDPYKRTIIRGAGKATIITEDGEVLTGEFADYDHGANAVGFESHFASCPNASSHRRRDRDGT